MRLLIDGARADDEVVTEPHEESPSGRSESAGGAGAPGSLPEDSLAPLRRQIDRIDRSLVELLNERARVVIEVGKHKRERGLPIYAPHRESELLSRVLGASTGPLSSRTIEAVFREVMSGSFALEQPLKIGYLGPPGSFSHVAAVAQFGSSVTLQDAPDIAAVFNEVRRGRLDYGLAPIENSIMGGVVETQDALRETRGDPAVYAEAQVSIRHCLLGDVPPATVRRIYSKPEVFAQCRKFLANEYARAELMPFPSSSAAVKAVREETLADPGAGVAAIGSSLAGQIYGVSVLFDGVEDNPSNVTRFYVLARQHARPTGDDKTSILFTTLDKPGALVAVLSVFDRAGVNLTHIDKRPSGRENWRYTFLIDAQGHREDGVMRTALQDAASHCQEVIVLGSYPRSTRIL